MKNLLLFVCIFLLATNGWAQQFVMPQGTSNNIYPFGSSTTNNKVQWLYYPSDFVVAPFAGNITTIYFKTWNNQPNYTATYSNFSIRMANTALTQFPNGTYITPVTLVYTGNPTVVPTTGQYSWFSFTLQTPFAYTGGNLIVEIEHNAMTAGIIYANCTQPTPNNNRRIYGNYGSATGTASITMGDIGLDMCASCSKPANVVKNNLSLHSVDLAWDPVSCASGYEYVIDQTTADPPSVGYATVPTPALSLTNLPDGTCYYVHIRTQCGGPYDTSAWMLDSFCTVADCKTPEVTIENITSTTAVARWDAVPGVIGYEYSVGTTPVPPVKGTNTTYTSVKLLGLMPNAPLYFFLKAKCSPTPESPWGITPFHTSAYTSVEDIDNSPISVFAYPNPVKDQVTIEVAGYGGKNPVIRLTDITGKLVDTKKMAGKSVNFNTANLSPGMYYVEYMDDQHKQVIKINKQ